MPVLCSGRCHRGQNHWMATAGGFQWWRADVLVACQRGFTPRMASVIRRRSLSSSLSSTMRLISRVESEQSPAARQCVRLIRRCWGWDRLRPPWSNQQADQQCANKTKNRATPRCGEYPIVQPGRAGNDEYPAQVQWPGTADKAVRFLRPPSIRYRGFQCGLDHRIGTEVFTTWCPLLVIGNPPRSGQR